MSLLIVAFAVGHRTCGLPSPVSDLPDSTTVQLDASALQRLKRAENCDLALPEDAERCALERLNTGLRYTALLFTGYRKPNFFSGLPHGGDDKILISALEKTLQLYDLHLSLNGSDRRGNETEDVEIRALGAVIQEIVNQTCDWVSQFHNN